MFSKHLPQHRQTGTSSVSATWSGPGPQAGNHFLHYFAPLIRPVYFRQYPGVIRFSLLWTFLVYVPALRRLRARAIAAISTRTSHSATPQKLLSSWLERGQFWHELARRSNIVSSSTCPFALFCVCFLFHFFPRLRKNLIFALAWS